jgi:hypothetical protein
MTAAALERAIRHDWLRVSVAAAALPDMPTWCTLGLARVTPSLANCPRKTAHLGYTLFRETEVTFVLENEQFLKIAPVKHGVHYRSVFLCDTMYRIFTKANTENHYFRNVDPQRSVGSQSDQSRRCDKSYRCVVCEVDRNTEKVAS